jgi:transglutaminase-like putative cysteine protease
MTNTVFLIALVSLAAEPTHKLGTAQAGRIAATISYDVQCESLTAGEWLLFAADAPTLPGQTDVKSRIAPAGNPITELSDLKRPILLARIPADTDELKHGVKLEVVYEATLWSRRLIPLRKGDRGPVVNDLTAAERAAALRSAGELQHDDEQLQEWLTDKKLIRGQEESEIDYARRVFTTIRKNFTYEYQPEMDRAPVAVCMAGKSDCGGLSNLLVAVLRSQGIPARTLAGRWAISADEGEKLNGHAYFQYHVKAEFFAAGVGWVPVDMASGVLHDRSREGLYFFGYDPGDFLVQHIDSDLEVDTVHFGKQSLVVLQRPAFWVTGSGKLDDLKIVEGWNVVKSAR